MDKGSVSEFEYLNDDPQPPKTHVIYFYVIDR